MQESWDFATDILDGFVWWLQFLNNEWYVREGKGNRSTHCQFGLWCAKLPKYFFHFSKTSMKIFWYGQFRGS